MTLEEEAAEIQQLTNFQIDTFTQSGGAATQAFRITHRPTGLSGNGPTEGKAWRSLAMRLAKWMPEVR